MKKNQKQSLIKNVFFTILFSISCMYTMVAQEMRNEINLSTGISLPLVTYDYASGNVASNGSNFYFNYGRVVKRFDKKYFTINAKYLSVSNSYSLMGSDIEELNSNSQLISLSGEWSGSADKFKMSSYLVGFGFHSYLSKNKKFISYLKTYIGNATLTSPNLDYISENGYKIKVSELKNSNIIYNFNGGISYEIYKNLSLGFNIDYSKSSFNYDAQKVIYSGINGASTDTINPYSLDYSTLNLNTELIFKF